MEVISRIVKLAGIAIHLIVVIIWWRRCTVSVPFRVHHRGKILLLLLGKIRSSLLETWTGITSHCTHIANVRRRILLVHWLLNRRGMDRSLMNVIISGVVMASVWRNGWRTGNTRWIWPNSRYGSNSSMYRSRALKIKCESQLMFPNR